MSKPIESEKKVLLNSDIINGYQVFRWDDGSYEAYDSNNNLVYRVLKNDETNVLTLNAKTQNGMIFSMDFSDEHPFSLSDIKPNATIVGKQGDEAVFSNGVLTKLSYNKSGSYNEGYYERIYNNNSKTEYKYDKKNGTLLSETGYDNSNGITYEKNIVDNTIVYYNNYGQYCFQDSDGSKIYFSDDGNDLIINKDGTYYTETERGTYVIDSNGNIICTDENNDNTFYDKYGHKYQKITNSGIIYDYDSDSQLMKNSNRVKYSRINHIEYDEGAYENILRSLNEISNSSVNMLNNAYSNIENSTNSFPDKYTGNIGNIKTKVNRHFNLIDSIAKMTNYSLLAYQTCDESLREGLELLINSLFGDSEPVLAASFKAMINYTIKEKDGILEYKNGTNFQSIYNNAIAYYTYIDDDGNKWYLSRNNVVVGLEGSNFKINYGGNEFYLNYDTDGVIKLIDHDGRNLNIFGDYNLSSTQYGSNQMVIKNSYDNPYIKEIISKYFKDSNTEEKIALLSSATNKGCGYAAITNMIFKEFEGNENDFYKAYGFPMYEIKKTSSDFVVDYNYEPVLLDLYCEINSKSGKYDISDTIREAKGIGKKEINEIYNYLKETKGITLGNAVGAEDIITDRGYALYEMNGKRLFQADEKVSHMMIVTNRDNENTYVSSWGEKCTYEKSSDDEYINIFNNIWNSVLSQENTNKN